MDSEQSRDAETLRRALIRLIAVADRVDARGAQALQRIEAGAAALDQRAQHLASGGERFAGEALRIIGAQADSAVEKGVGQAVQRCQGRLEESTHTAVFAANEVKEAAMELRGQRSLWLWSAPLALLVGAMLAAGGSTYLTWKNMRELERAEFGQDILYATQAGTLTRCGEALCVKAGKRPMRYGEDGEYILLQE